MLDYQILFGARIFLGLLMREYQKLQLANNRINKSKKESDITSTLEVSVCRALWNEEGPSFVFLLPEEPLGNLFNFCRAVFFIPLYKLGNYVVPRERNNESFD